MAAQMATVQAGEQSDEHSSHTFQSRGYHPKNVNSRGPQYWCRTCNLMKLFTTSPLVYDLTCANQTPIKGYVGNDMFHNVVAYIAYGHQNKCFISQNRDPSVYCWLFSDFLRSNLEKINYFLEAFTQKHKTLYFTVIIRNYPKWGKEHPHGFLLFDAGIDFYQYFAQHFLRPQDIPQKKSFRPTHNDPEFASEAREFHKIDARDSSLFTASFSDGFAQHSNSKFAQYIEEFTFDTQTNAYVASSRYLMFVS